MSYNGSGTFVINTAGQPVVSGTVISSTAFNALTADLATGLSTAITKDGQTTPTANIPMGNNKITGLAVGTAATDAANLSQVQSTTAKLINSISGTDTITGTMSPTLGAYATGQMFYFIAAGDNTGAVTLNIDSLGAKAVTRDGSVALAASDLKSGEVVVVVYDGTRFQVVSQLNSSGDARFANVSIASALNVGGVATFSAGTAAAPSITTSGDTNTGIFFPAADTIAFAEGGVEAARFDSSGNFGLGVTPSAVSDLYKNIQNGTAVLMGKAGQADVYLNANATFNSGWKYIVNGFATRYSQNDVAGGAHTWFTAASGTAGNAITFTQAMTLDASGRLGIGTTSPGYRLETAGTQNNNDIVITNTTTSSSLRMQSVDAYGAVFVTGNYPLMLGTNNTERARIHSGGGITVGGTTDDGVLTSVQTSSTVVQFSLRDNTNTRRAFFLGSGYYGYQWAQIIYADGGKAYTFANAAGTESGSIVINNASVAYNTTSDYRLKDQQKPLIGSGAFIDAIKPKEWVWKNSGERGVGFIAHELAEVSPSSVSGEKDAVGLDMVQDENGKYVEKTVPKYQSVSYSSGEIIANLVSEIQSLRARVAALEAK